MTATEHNEKALLKKISELEAELKKVKKQKKYGLVWEDKPEQIVEDCKRNVPILRLKEKKKGIDPVVTTDISKDENILIEGDNYHALSVLNYTHKGKVDVIYIDPPYNTGAKDWKYNNDYVDGNDPYRHSKWISLMSKRLALAKELLTKRGVLMCAIDENEHAHLGVLLEAMFPDREIHCIPIIHNPSGVQGKNFSYNHEYVYFVIPTGNQIIDLQDREHNPDIRPLRDVSTGNHLREDAKNCFYPIFVKDEKVIGFGDVCDDSFHPKSVNVMRDDGVMEIYPIDPQGNERKWVFARQTVDEIKDDLFVEYNRQRKILDIIRKKTKFNYKTIWDDKMYNANIYGTQLLSNILDIKFPFPKSLYAVMECIKAVMHDKDKAVILDFFAGSGTTGHAVLELNNRDGGNRKFILCTNNESNICEEVTYERIKRVMKGYKNKKGETVKGFGGNLRYYKTDLVDIEKLHHTPDHAKVKLTYQTGEMIGLRENTLNEVEKNDWWQIFEGHGKNTAIYFKEDKEKLQDLVELLEKKKQPAVLYIFSWGKNEYKSEYSSANIRVEDIPEPILEVYKEINRL